MIRILKTPEIASCLLALAVFGLWQTAFAQNPGTIGTPTAYSYSGSGLIPAATPTDVIVLTGSAKTVSVTNIMVCGRATTAATLDVSLVKRTSADSAGTSSAITPVNLTDTSLSASSAVAAYTANPTLGTNGGTIHAPPLNVGAASSGCIFLDFGTRDGAGPLILRGTAHQLAINFGGAAIPAGLTLNWRIEVMEQ